MTIIKISVRNIIFKIIFNNYKLNILYKTNVKKKKKKKLYV